ncbi:hypothetical protein [Oleiharenicola sp. Vm1]|uniref:hypothetical protein n=1 Tax=Oleiharenicola sp. Vm1 TaxID=3398393 RepID=UPI0039F4D170
MKTNQSLLIVALLGFSAAISHAGPPPEFFNQTLKLAKAKTQQVATVTKAAKPAMACDACKVTPIREVRYRGPASKAVTEWVNVGEKHACAKCGGAVESRNGKIASNMELNCPICREASCCPTTATH